MFFLLFYFTEIEFCYVSQAGLHCTHSLGAGALGMSHHSWFYALYILGRNYWLSHQPRKAVLRTEWLEFVKLSAITISRNHRVFSSTNYDVPICTFSKFGLEVLPLVFVSFNFFLSIIIKKKAMWKLSLNADLSHASRNLITRPQKTF